MDLSKFSENIVYHPWYNVRFLGLEKLHPFDSCKYEKIAAHLDKLDVGYISPQTEVSEKELKTVHTKQYLERLTYSSEVAKICEMNPLQFVPNFLLQRYLLSPMRWQVAGTILATQTALQKGWSINLGGGMHHASANDGGGWCVYSDITLALLPLFRQKKISSAAVIDLDVHQGNGIETDILSNVLPMNRVIMADGYNPNIYPCDIRASQAIWKSFAVTKHTKDSTYIRNVQKILEDLWTYYRPDIVVYNAGTDVLAGDPLNGGVSISADGVIARDSLVMKFFVQKKVPIVMLLSGGYSGNSANVISQSIENLLRTIGH
jgi:histone deacetylase 11